MRRPSVRLVDVAEHAGVSLATASRILNSGKSGGGRPELRERVLAAVDELGYEPNLHARALAGSTSATIGLVVHDIRDPYFSLIAGAVVEAAEAHDLFVTIVSTYNDPSREAKYIRLLRVQRPRAIIVAGSGFTSQRASGPIAKELRRFEEDGGVVVCLGEQKIGHRIVVGNEEGARQLAHRLVDLGHREFAVVGGPARMTTVRDRVSGFVSGLEERGVTIDPAAIRHCEASRESGEQLAQSVLAADPVPTCVFGTFDRIAVGLVSGFQSAGLRVPQDVSVVGFADVPPAADISPALTTVRLPLDLVGQQAVELALSAEPEIRRTLAFEGTVVLRESTAAPAAQLAAR